MKKSSEGCVKVRPVRSELSSYKGRLDSEKLTHATETQKPEMSADWMYGKYRVQITGTIICDTQDTPHCIPHF